MRTLPYYGYHEFEMAEFDLFGKGWDVINPHHLDRNSGFDVFSLPRDYDWSQVPPDLDMDATIRRDIEAVMNADAIYMLNGWEQSTGAVAEHAVALWAGKEVLFETQPIYKKVVAAATECVVKVMRGGLKKHAQDSWLQEGRDNHALKSVRHMITWTLQQDGNTPEDGEDHLSLAMCRAAMCLAQRNEQQKEKP
jgi:hypothetical protein